MAQTINCGYRNCLRPFKPKQHFCCANHRAAEHVMAKREKAKRRKRAG